MSAFSREKTGITTAMKKRFFNGCFILSLKIGFSTIKNRGKAGITTGYRKIGTGLLYHGDLREIIGPVEK